MIDSFEKLPPLSLLSLLSLRFFHAGVKDAPQGFMVRCTVGPPHDCLKIVAITRGCGGEGGLSSLGYMKKHHDQEAESLLVVFAQQGALLGIVQAKTAAPNQPC